jgi:hypothetical protein
MSDHAEGRNGVVNPSVKFEPTDLSLRAVLTFSAVLAGVIVVVCVGLWFLVPAFLGPTPRQQPKEPWDFTEGPRSEPSASGLPAPPELEGIDRTGPEVQGMHTARIEQQIAAEEKTLNAPAGVDEKTGTIHIPIEDAMREMAGRSEEKP